jgi:hypothetical protein
MKIALLSISFLIQSLPIALAIGQDVPRSDRANTAVSDTILVSPGFSGSEPVNHDRPIDLYLSRPLRDPESRVAVLIGTTDVSSLFEQSDLRLRYNPKLWPLPLGQSEVTVYVVTKDDAWQEIATFSLFVVKQPARTRDSPAPDVALSFNKPSYFGELSASSDARLALALFPEQEQAKPDKQSKNWKMNLLPSLNVGLKTQPAESTFPSANTPADRATFADLTMQASMKSDTKYGIFSSQSSFDFAGSSFQQEALRFGTLGNVAPKVDLASYLIQLQTGRVKYQVGHFNYGSQRHLINSFSSRGINITVPFLRYFDFSAAVMNGTQLVGYDNFLGLNKRRHQMLGGTLGVELFPKRAGTLRVEVGVLSAYFQPISGVNRGVITDLQRSRGVSVRLIGSDKNARLRFEAGFTRSLFASPNDTTLEQGVKVVPLPTLLRNAHYFEINFDVLRNAVLTKTKRVNLAISFREENVAPLFRSLGASTQADKIQYDFAATGSVGDISGQFSRSDFHDNLRGVPSILRTINGLTNFSLAAPAKAILNRTKDSPWLPRLGLSFSRVHASGDAIPVNGGFEIDPGSIPDLIGTNKTFSADWQIKKFNVGYNLNHSFQNNEQKGRELADQYVLVNTGRVGIAVNTRLNLNVDLSADNSRNRETGRIDRTYRLGPSVTWQLTKSIGFTGSLSNTIAGDVANTSRNHNTEFDWSATYRFGAGKEGPKKVAGQFFIRYANRYSHTLDRIFFIDNLSKNQTLTANLSFTFF